MSFIYVHFCSIYLRCILYSLYPRLTGEPAWSAARLLTLPIGGNFCNLSAAKRENLCRKFIPPLVFTVGSTAELWLRSENVAQIELFIRNSDGEGPVHCRADCWDRAQPGDQGNLCVVVMRGPVACLHLDSEYSGNIIYDPNPNVMLTRS